MKPAWLTARPIAHRGLHNAAAGVIENTVSAFRAAIDGNYGIETDVQISADSEAMVHHDDALGRLTEGHTALAQMSAADIKSAKFKATGDRILTLSEFLELVAGRVPVVIELKSHFNGDTRLAERAAGVLAGYRGHAAVMSFDPALIERIRAIAPELTRGIVAERHYTHPEWDRLSRTEKIRLAFLLHAPSTRPHFIAYSGRDLPALAPVAARGLGLPLLTWTIHSEAEQARVLRFADQVIFESFLP